MIAKTSADNGLTSRTSPVAWRVKSLTGGAAAAAGVSALTALPPPGGCPDSSVDQVLVADAVSCELDDRTVDATAAVVRARVDTRRSAGAQPCCRPGSHAAAPQSAPA